MNQLEKDKFTERLDFAIELLERKFPSEKSSSILMTKAVEIGIALFVRSEISYDMSKKK